MTRTWIHIGAPRAEVLARYVESNDALLREYLPGKTELIQPLGDAPPAIEGFSPQQLAESEQVMRAVLKTRS